jgi:hypothetical protein
MVDIDSKGKDDNPQRDAESALAALKRAALRARKRAKGTSGYVVIYENGQVVKEPVG